MSHSLEIDSVESSRRRKFLRRKTQSETWLATQTAVWSGGKDESVSNDISVQITNGLYKPVKEKTADNVTPSVSSLKDLERVIHLIESERHLVAYKLYVDVKRRLDEWLEQRDSAAREKHERNNNVTKSPMRWKKFSWISGRHNDYQNADNKAPGPSGNEEAYNFYIRRKKEFEALEKRAIMFKRAQQNLNKPTSWILAQTLFGITTHYRREDDNTLSVKIEGELHGIPLFEQMVVLRECDLYHTWAPFCSASRKLAQLDKLDVVAWFNVGTPLLGLVRDACYRAVGCDCMREDGSVLIVAVGLGGEDEKSSNGEESQQQQTECSGQLNQTQQQMTQEDEVNQAGESSVPILNTNATSFLTRDELLSTIELPSVRTGIGHGRMTIRNFSASIKILGASSARTKMVVNIDPNLHFLPQSLIDFCMKRMCGVLLGRLQAAARKVMKDPVKNPHARRMREDVRFYRDWLLPKFRTYCDELGWVMPPVRAFEVSEDDLKLEEIFEGWRSVDSCTNNSTENENCVRSTLQQYQIVDNVLHANPDACHRQVQSESFVETRVRRRDKLKQLVQHGSSGIDDDCTPSFAHSEASTSLQQRNRDKIKLFFREKETKEEKIAAAREKAILRMRPEPLSQSKAMRLKELKDAKTRAEERLLRKNRTADSLSGSELGSIRSDLLTSSFRSDATDDEVDEDIESKRNATILIISLLLNVVLLPFKSYAFAVLELPPYLEMSSTDWADLLPRNILSIFMIGLHATSLWATLNTFLVVAFDTIDFGQKHLAKNLEYAKKMYVDVVKKYSTMVSTAVAAASLLVGLFSVIFDYVILKICLRLEDKFAMPSFTETLPTKYSWIVGNISNCMLLARDSAVLIVGWINVVAFKMRIPIAFKYACIIVSSVISTISGVIPFPLKRLGNTLSISLFKSVSNAIIAHFSICKDRTAAALSWRSEAYHISSFITTRLAVFVLALLLMSYLVLPKPEQRLMRKEARRAKDHVPMKEVALMGEIVRTPTRQNQHRSLRSSGSIPMEIISEE